MDVGSHHWLTKSHHATAQFQRHKWTPTTITPRFCICARLRLSALQHQTIYVRDCRARTTPCRFYQRHAEWTKVFGNHLLAFSAECCGKQSSRFLRAIDSRRSGMVAPLRQYACRESREQDRKLYPKPEYTKPKPCEPVARCRNSRENLHCGNIVTFCRYDCCIAEDSMSTAVHSIGWAISTTMVPVKSVKTSQDITTRSWMRWLYFITGWLLSATDY